MNDTIEIDGRKFISLHRVHNLDNDLGTPPTVYHLLDAVDDRADVYAQVTCAKAHGGEKWYHLAAIADLSSNKPSMMLTAPLGIRSVEAICRLVREWEATRVGEGHGLGPLPARLNLVVSGFTYAKVARCVRLKNAEPPPERGCPEREPWTFDDVVSLAIDDLLHRLTHTRGQLGGGGGRQQHGGQG